MLIKGKYVKDSNFTTVFAEDTMYTIARNTGDWDCIKIGDRMANGHILSKETFEAWKSECEEEGEFELED